MKEATKQIDEDATENDLLGGLRISSTADIKVLDRPVGQVIGRVA